MIKCICGFRVLPFVLFCGLVAGVMAHGDEDQEPVTGGVPSADLPEQEPEQELAVIDMTLPERVGLGVDEYRWINRLVVVFADSGSDPRFREQMTFLREDEGDLLDRDVVVLVDTNPAAESALRLRYRPRGFVVLLVGKDGALALRKPVPWNVRALRNAIDKLPVRQQEMKGG